MVAPIGRRILDGALEVAVVPSFSRIGPLVRNRLWDWSPVPPAALDGEVVVVTGATSGLGAQIALDAARAGAIVEVVGRNPERGAAVVDRIEAAGGRATFRSADLSDLDAVTDLAHTLGDAHPRVRAIVHNAGALLPRRETSAQGLEVTWASMVVAPHLLTRLLADRLERAIWMSSGGMYLQALDLDDWSWSRREWDGTRAYAQAKRAQVDLVAEATDRGEGPVQFAMHPGWADTPGVDAALPGFKKVMGPLLRTPADGADTATWLVAEPVAALVAGGFYLDRRPRSTVRWPGTGTSVTDRRALRALVDGQAGLSA